MVSSLILLVVKALKTDSKFPVLDLMAHSVLWEEA